MEQMGCNELKICSNSINFNLVDRETAVINEGSLVVGNVGCSITIGVISDLRRLSA